MPALNAARSTARRASCQNSMRQVGLAVHHYLNVHAKFPPAKCTYTYRRSGTTTISTIGHGLIPFLLPFIEQTAAASRYRFDVNWQNAANQEARNVRISLLLCPDAEPTRFYRSSASSETVVEYFCSDYASCEMIWGIRNQLRRLGVDRGTRDRNWRSILASADLGSRNDPIVRSNSAPTAAEVLSGLRIYAVVPQDVTDGLSYSMMLFECTGRPNPITRVPRANSPPPAVVGGARWADSDSTFWMNNMCNGTQMFNCDNRQEIFSFHTGGSNFVYGDGAVRFHSESMSPGAFVSRFTAFASDFLEPL